jgi:hypothetical protein
MDLATRRDTHYYKKYKGYLRIETPKIKPLVPVPEDAGLQKSLKQWTPNYDTVNEFVKETLEIMNKGSNAYRGLKIDKQSYFNIVNNFGLIERKRIDLIAKGTLSPAKELDTAACQTRQIKLHGYIQNLLLMLDQTANFKNISNPEIEVQILYEKMPEPDKRILSQGRAEKIMNLINPSFGSFNYYSLSKELKKYTPLVAAQYTFEYLLRVVLAVVKFYKGKISQPILDEIVLILVHIVYDAERAGSKLLENKEASINSLIQKMIPADLDSNLIDNSESRMYDDLVSPDAVDKFSYADIDYDGHNDNWD